MSIAGDVYNYLKSESVDKVDKRVAVLMRDEADFISTQYNVLGSPYLSFSVFLDQAMSVFVCLIKLVKNILLLLVPLLLALGALFYDWTVARNLGFTTAGRVLLVALNLTNVVLGLVSIVVNGLSLYKMLETKFNEPLEGSSQMSPKEMCDVKQTTFRDHVKDRFFKPIKIDDTFSTTKMCFDEITADLGLW